MPRTLSEMCSARESTVVHQWHRSKREIVVVVVVVERDLVTLSFFFQQELTEMNLKLKSQFNQLVNEYQSNKQDLQQVSCSLVSDTRLSLCLSSQMNNQCSATIENARRAFFNERNEMEKKTEHLIEQLKQYKNRLNQLEQEKKDNRTRSETFSQKLKDKSQLIEAKLKEIQQKELSLQ
jgi:ATP-dependent Lon protease